MSRKLDDLHPMFKPMAVEFLARLTERGLPVMVVDTLRTAEEHAANLKSGVSKTKLSLHMGVGYTGKWGALAMDIAPYEVFQLHGGNKLQWNGTDPAWGLIGETAHAVGMDWGGDWQFKDWGHVEHPRGRLLADLKHTT